MTHGQLTNCPTRANTACVGHSQFHGVRRMVKQKRRRLRITDAPSVDDLIAFTLYSEGQYWKPKVRDDCAQVARPCPFVTCRYNLYLDVTPKGRVHLNFPDIAPHEMTHSCALDVRRSNPGGMTLEDVGSVLALTRERIRQIQSEALDKMKVDKETDTDFPWSTS